ncbi:MAG: MFS transporter [Planctomycetota bacterium]|nr:MFS transporter [Planctomycetota bacterium]
MGRPLGLARVNDHGAPGHPMTWLVWFVPAIFFLYEYLLRVAPGVIEKDLEKQFHLDEGGMGGALGMYYYAYAPMQLVVGVLLDRYGARLLLTLAAVFCSIGLVFFSMAETPSELAASRFIVGFGSSFAFIGAIYVAIVWFNEEKVAFLTGLTAGMGFGIGIFTEWFLADIFGQPPQWRPDMLVLAGVGLVIAAGIWCIVPQRPAWYLDVKDINKRCSIREAIGGLGKVMRKPAIWMISLGCAFVYLPLPLAANWGPRSLGELLSIPELEGSHLFAWFYLGVALGSPLVGWLSDRMGRRKPLLVAGAASTSVLTVLIITTAGLTTTSTAILLLGWGLCTSTYILGYPLAASAGPKETSGSAIAFVNFIGMLLAGIFVWVFGLVVDAIAAARGHVEGPDASDFRTMFLLIGIAMILAAGLHLCVRERRKLG